jgi:hypothetical protein
MPFNYLGTWRPSQWKAFRDWVLQERSAVSARVAYINAELRRIGIITVFYQEAESTVTTPEGAERVVSRVSEKRTGFTVTRGSSLEKLIQCYVMAGGNPMSISLWLQPDEMEFTTLNDPQEDQDDDPKETASQFGFQSNPYTQPYGGVLAPTTASSYGPAGRWVGGLTQKEDDANVVIGRTIDQSSANAKIAIRMDYARRWTQQAIMELANIEYKIIKLMDLRERLVEERDHLIQQAVGGTVSMFPVPPDPDRFARAHALSRIVSQMDFTVYEQDAEGLTDFDQIKRGTAESPKGISNHDTILDIDPDPFAHG